MSNLIQEPMEAYHARKAMSASMAWDMVNECPLLAWHRSPFNPDHVTENNLDFDLGKAVHALLLEASEFDQRIVEVPFDNYLTNAAKETRAAAYASGKTPLLTKHLELTYRVCHMIELQCDLFQGGQAEMTYLWNWDGVPCKARVDYLVNRRPQRVLLIDLKTAASASPQAFQRAMILAGHHLRAAWYLDGYLAGVSTEPAQYRYVVVGKDEPHIVSEFEIGPRALAWGRRLYLRALNQFSVFMKSGIWPGYVERLTAVELPTHAEYALADLEAEGAL